MTSSSGDRPTVWHVRGVVLPDDEVRDLWLVGDRVTHEPVPGAVGDDVHVGEPAEPEIAFHERLGDGGQSLEREEPGERPQHGRDAVDAEEPGRERRPQPDHHSQPEAEQQGGDERRIDVPPLQRAALDQRRSDAHLRHDGGQRDDDERGAHHTEMLR